MASNNSNSKGNFPNHRSVPEQQDLDDSSPSYTPAVLRRGGHHQAIQGSPSPSSSGPYTPNSYLSYQPSTLYYTRLLEAVQERLEQYLLENPKRRKMAVQQLVFIEGSFADLSEEFASYIDNINKADAASGLSSEIKPLLESNQKDEVLKKLVVGAIALNSAPEKEYSAAYNLLIYLMMQSPNSKIFLPKFCENVMKPLTTSPINGPGLAVSVLSILFNFLEENNETRYNVFLAILRVVKNGGLFENLRPQLKFIPRWVKLWDLEEEDQRKLYGAISEVAEDAGDKEEAYQWVLKSLRTFTSEDNTSDEAQALSLKALKAAILSPTHLDFHDLTALPPIQALSDSHPVHSELLAIFSEKDLEDYVDFNDEHEGFLEQENLDHEVLHRKMRLLTFASLAATTNSREIEYKRIAKALSIPMEDVEMWVIDVIRAGLVEGKLSQQKQVFLVHRTTYRVFGEKQWREVATRLDTLKMVLQRSLEVVRRERLAAEAEKAKQEAEANKAANGGGFGGGMNNSRRKPRDDNDD